jgi:hypothetical protein
MRSGRDWSVHPAEERAASEEIKRRVRDVWYAPALETARDRAADVPR